MQTSTIVTILSAIVALASALSPTLLDALWPGHGNYLATLLSVAAIVAGVIINAITKQEASLPNKFVLEDAPIAKADGTTTGATNVTTTSTLPIVAPQKGP